jgi:polysaccharide export outer membrane protein
LGKSGVTDLYFFLSIMASFLMTPSIPAAAEQPGAYRIGPEDILEISVWKDPDLTKKIVVRPDGNISFPLIGEVGAGGHSVEWVEKEIKERIKEYVPEARVCVDVLQINSIKIYVTGKVAKSGEYRIGKRLNIMQAISLAGGMTTFADPGNILILRTEDSSQTKIPFDYDRVKKGRDLEQNIMLETGDVVVVP